MRSHNSGQGSLSHSIRVFSSDRLVLRRLLGSVAALTSDPGTPARASRMAAIQEQLQALEQRLFQQQHEQLGVSTP